MVLGWVSETLTLNYSILDPEVVVLGTSNWTVPKTKKWSNTQHPKKKRKAFDCKTQILELLWIMGGKY